MKNLFINIILIALSIQCCLAITSKQIIIPMNGNYAMSFYKDIYNDYYIDGFAIDSLERLFFCGGKDTSYISCFQDDYLLFSKKIGPIVAGPILIKDSNLYIHTDYNTNNVLQSYKIDLDSIRLNKKVNIISAKKINNIFFTNSSFIVETLETNRDSDGIHLNSKYNLFNLLCQHKQEVDNPYDLPQSVFKEKELGSYQYIGMYKQNYVFYSIHNPDTCVISFRDKKGNAIMSQEIPLKLLGTTLTSSYGGNPEEHKKIKNEKLYILGNKEGDLVITIFSLQNLFEGN